MFELPAKNSNGKQVRKLIINAKMKSVKPDKVAEELGNMLFFMVMKQSGLSIREATRTIMTRISFRRQDSFGGLYQYLQYSVWHLSLWDSLGK